MVVGMYYIIEESIFSNNKRNCKELIFNDLIVTN